MAPPPEKGHVLLTAEKILEGLTPPQREAATTIDGPLLVLAGAGSGKTRTITRRIAYMVACGIPAWNIVALTFTNKASGEMKQRVDQLLGSEQSGRRMRGVTVATFHSLCARLGREYAEALGLPPSFSIFDGSDQSRLVKAVLKELSLSAERFTPASVLSAISKAKNALQGPQEYAAASGGFVEKNIARVYTRYEALLRENKAVDFDDLLLKIALLLRDNGAVRGELQERYQYILIDEYQDTNQAQFLIAHMLASRHQNICATGDPDQSIYGWRGANLKNILDFEAHYPKAKIVLLEQNYRSTKIILQAASSLIANNTHRKKKDLWTENEAGPRIVVLKTADEHQEAREVVERLKTAHAREKISWDKMAVFYRMNSLSRVLEDALMRAAVPYQIARGTEFYGRKEVKDVLAYLKVVANPADAVSLERIMNVPPRGLGDTTAARLSSFAAEEGISMLDACGRAADIGGLGARAVNGCLQIADLFERWRKLAFGGAAVAATAGRGRGRNDAPGNSSARQSDPQGDHLFDSASDHESDSQSDPLFDASLADAMADSEEIAPDFQDQSPSQSEDATAGGPGPASPTGLPPEYVIPGGVKHLMETVVRESGLEDALKKKDPENEQSGNINELISVAAEFDAQNPGGSLNDYLQQVSLASDVDRIQDGGGAVTLMTLHAAKGLEFPFVAMVGMEDGLLPHARALNFMAGPHELEEERRLAFVGVTRAMRQLVLTYASNRMIRGITQRSVASQFLKELPAECLDCTDLSGEGDAGSGSYRDEAGYGRRSEQQTQRATEARQQKQVAQTLAGQFAKGALVRHPQFGLGRIEDISPAGSMTRVVVSFQGAGRKTLILQYARLERVDG